MKIIRFLTSGVRRKRAESKLIVWNRIIRNRREQALYELACDNSKLAKILLDDANRLIARSKKVQRVLYA